jgi:hypothetical protein
MVVNQLSFHSTLYILSYRLSLSKYINWLCHIRRLHVSVFDFSKVFFMPCSVSYTRFLRKLLLIGIRSTFYTVEHTLHHVEVTGPTVYKFCCSTQMPVLHTVVQWLMWRNLRAVIPIVRLLCDHIYRSRTILSSCDQGQVLDAAEQRCNFHLLVVLVHSVARRDMWPAFTSHSIRLVCNKGLILNLAA